MMNDTGSSIKTFEDDGFGFCMKGFGRLTYNLTSMDRLSLSAGF